MELRNFTSNANIVGGGSSRPPQHNNKHDFKGKGKFHNKNVGQRATSTTIRTTTKAQLQIRQMWCKPKRSLWQWCARHTW